MTTLRQDALAALRLCDVAAKIQCTRALDFARPVGPGLRLADPGDVPGRPALPRLVPHIALKQRSVNTLEGRAQLLHSIAHIEMNAVNLALDVAWRFPDMPEAFYVDWLRIAQEEARHFTLLRDHLATLGFDYGAFDAHDSLWDMAERTKDDVLARIALVPRTLEARGLDASPAVKRKLLGVGDAKAGEILDVILRDEIGHVAAGNRWYRWLCTQRGLEPLATYAELAHRFGAPKLRAPFNIEARRLAGFDDEELRALGA
ncbi:MAG: ferritin-like domain-containing protein [Vitreoscilla sp.]